MAPRSVALPMSSSSFVGLEFVPRDSTKPHAIARSQERRRAFVYPKQPQRSATKHIPTARRFQRINPSLSIGDRNRAGRDLRARTFQTGHAQLLRQTGQKRKTGHEPDADYGVFGR